MSEEYKNEKCNGKCKDYEAMKMKELANFYGTSPTQSRGGFIGWFNKPITITFAEGILVSSALLWLTRKEIEAVLSVAKPYESLLIALVVIYILTSRRKG